MKAIARLLRRLANQLDAPVLPARPVATPDADYVAAQRMIDDITLRRALRDSLRRFSPEQEIGQA